MLKNMEVILLTVPQHAALTTVPDEAHLDAAKRPSFKRSPCLNVQLDQSLSRLTVSFLQKTIILSMWTAAGFGPSL